MKKFKQFITASLLLTQLLIVSCKNDDNAVPALEPSLPVEIASGAPISGSNGIYFGTNDQLHVASVIDRSIHVINLETKEIISVFTPEDGIEGPDDLVFGPDGSLYWTSLLTGEVGKMDSEGNVTKQFVAPGVNPITFSDDGRLFVALCFLGDGLYELDPDLLEDPKLIVEGPLGFLNGMDFGPDGKLYGPLFAFGKVIAVDVDTKEIETIIDELIIPTAIKFDSNGDLYGIDPGPGELFRIDLETKSKETLTISDNLKGADNLAFNSAGELFISNYMHGGIYQVDKLSGNLEEISDHSSFATASDLAMVDGKLCLPDMFSLKEVDPSSGDVRIIERNVLGKPGLASAFTVDQEDNRLALSSWFGNEVQIWNLDNEMAEETYKDYPVPLNAILTDGALIVSELGLQPGEAKITRQMNGSREVLMDGSQGLVIPSGLAALDGNVYAADFYSGRVYQIMEDDEMMESPVIIIQDLLQPEGIELTSSGKLLIMETGANQVVSVDLNTNEKKVIAANISMGLAGPSGAPPTWLFSGLTVDESTHTLYFTSDFEKKIYKVENAF